MNIVICKMITWEVFKKVFPVYEEAFEFKKKLYTSLYSCWQVDFTSNCTLFKTWICFIEIRKQNDLLDNI